MPTQGVKLECRNWRVLALLVALATTLVASRARAATPLGGERVRETFSATFTVTIAADDPSHADVQWDLAGIDEIERVRLRVHDPRFSAFEATGGLERRGTEVLWRPSSPYARLRYRVDVPHRRAEDKGYDSFVGDGWILTRTSDLFPRTAVLFRPDIETRPEARARLVFRLPAAWRSVTAMPPAGPHEYVVESPRSRWDAPRGWMMLGRFAHDEATVGETVVTVASAPGSKTRANRVLAFVRDALPELTGLLARPLPRLLVVTAPDPMWRGGLSGEESFYMHGDRPLRTPDRTSPYLHELFHVVAPFRPAPDAHWVTEGLAEYYSVELQYRRGLVDERGYRKALTLFARYGVWGRDFTRAPDPALLNNSAPLVMAALDRRIRATTEGRRRLDDVVASVARRGGAVSTAFFLGEVRRVAGRSFSGFFRRHVYRGEQPPVPRPAESA
jgi:hypothetical protein